MTLDTNSNLILTSIFNFVYNWAPQAILILLGIYGAIIIWPLARHGVFWVWRMLSGDQINFHGQNKFNGLKSEHKRIELAKGFDVPIMSVEEHRGNNEDREFD